MSSSLGDLRPEMMESETPPSGAPSDRADEPEVSSQREPPGLAKPDSSAPTGVRLKDLLEKASISEDHHALMSMVIERISSAKADCIMPSGVCWPGLRYIKMTHLLTVLHIECAPYR